MPSVVRAIVLGSVSFTLTGVGLLLAIGLAVAGSDATTAILRGPAPLATLGVFGGLVNLLAHLVTRGRSASAQSSHDDR